MPGVALSGALMQRGLLAVLAASGVVAFQAAGAADSAPDRRAVGGPVVVGPAGSSDPATGKALLDLMQQVEQLQGEVRNLRDTVEVQRHDMEGLQNRSRDLNADFDRRLRELEMRASAPPAPAAEAPVTPGPAAASAVQTEEYEAAFNLMKDGKYDRATNAFRAFIEKYPESAYADNAHYWIGEAHAARGDNSKAITAFEAVIKRFPDSDGAKLAAERLDQLKSKKPAAGKSAPAGKKPAGK
jgi:tol-pal system protein YbgF